jgi:hypothetical protein
MQRIFRQATGNMVPDSKCPAKAILPGKNPWSCTLKGSQHIFDTVNPHG